MTLDHLKKREGLISAVLLTVATVAALLTVYKVVGYFTAPARAENAVKEAITQIEPDSKNLTKQLDKSKKVADGLKSDNLFSPPAPKQDPIQAVMGIAGDEALINGKWYKAGDKVGDAKILAVNPTTVETEWNGQKKTFNPIDGAGGSGPGEPPRSGRPTVTGRSGPSGGAQTVISGSVPRPGGGGMPSPADIRNMSEAERDKFRQQMRERFERMSEAERDRFRSEMRERMGGERGGDRGGRGGPGGGRGGR